MDLALRDKVVLITGASGGIGRALAEVFAAEGAQLALQGHSRIEALEAWVAGQPWSQRAHTQRVDVSDRGQVSAGMRATLERFGRIDVCVACAGVWPRGDLLLHGSSNEGGASL